MASEKNSNMASDFMTQFVLTARVVNWNLSPGSNHRELAKNQPQMSGLQVSGRGVMIDNRPEFCRKEFGM
jgi:hypothetical protein